MSDEIKRTRAKRTLDKTGEGSDISDILEVTKNEEQKAGNAKTIQPELKEERRSENLNTASRENIIKEIAADPEMRRLFADMVGINSPPEDMVELICMMDISPGMTVGLGESGKFGTFTEFGQVIEVSLKDFRNQLRDARTVHMLNTRQIVVGNGLPHTLRSRYKVQYNPGEVLRTEQYESILDLDTNDLVTLYSALTKHHKNLIGAKLVEKWEDRDPRVTRSKIEALNAICKKEGKGVFVNLLKNISEEQE